MSRLYMTEGTSALQANESRFRVIDCAKEEKRPFFEPAARMFVFDDDELNYDVDDYDFVHAGESKVSSLVIMGLFAVAGILALILPPLF